MLPCFHCVCPGCMTLSRGRCNHSPADIYVHVCIYIYTHHEKSHADSAVCLEYSAEPVVPCVYCRVIIIPLSRRMSTVQCDLVGF